MRLSPLAAGIAALAVATTVQAQQTQINLLPYVNDAVTTYCCSADAYPTSGVLTNLGVTFSMASLAGPGAPLDVWRADLATDRTFTLAIGLSGLSHVYTLMNTRFGFRGDPTDPTTAQGVVTFNYSDLSSSTQYLFGCYNIRDHNPQGYSNTADCWPDGALSSAAGPSNAEEFARFSDGVNGPVVFDMQTWDVDPTKTLTSITFEDPGSSISTPFLRAVTVDATVSTPEPASIALMSTGLVGVARVVRRRRAQRA